jgi:hypothetical protein
LEIYDATEYSCGKNLQGEVEVGDGTKISIMSDPWLKKEDGLWAQSPQQQGCV